MKSECTFCIHYRAIPGDWWKAQWEYKCEAGELGRINCPDFKYNELCGERNKEWLGIQKTE